MNILVSNDDEVRAEGIRCLCAALVKKGHRVYLSAPASQMSGASHSLTTQRPITLREISYDKAEQALSVEGTPTDCVKLGIKYFQAKNVRLSGRRKGPASSRRGRRSRRASPRESRSSRISSR